jgi:Ca2+-binding EF-hand superfamily protein
MMRKADMPEEKRSHLEAMKQRLRSETKLMLNEMFASSDVDSSGFLSREEIHKALSNDLGIQVSDDMLDSWLAVADADGSDFIDQDEWLILMAEAMEPKKNRAELLHAINTIATAGAEIQADGTVDMEEWSTILLDILPSNGIKVEAVQEMVRYISARAASGNSKSQSNRLNVNACIEVLTSFPDLFSTVPSARLSKKLTPLELPKEGL